MSRDTKGRFMSRDQAIKQIEEKAIKDAHILLNDQSMTPENRRVWALATISAAAVQINQLQDA